MSTAPMRISIAGGGTDLPEYYRHGPTSVLALTVDRFVHVALADEPDAALGALPDPPGGLAHVVAPAAAGEHAYVTAAGELLGVGGGWHLAIGSQVRPGSGLGGSGAFSVALLDILARADGRELSPADLAVLAFRLEREVLGRPVGQQDGWAAAIGGAVRIDLAPDGSATACANPALYEVMAQLLGRGLLLFRTADQRDAGRVLAHAPAVDPQRYAQALAAAAETEAAFLSGDVAVIGAALRAHWAAKIAANPHTDHPVCRAITQRSAEVGIHGFKLVGAGGAGHLLIAADPDRRDESVRFLTGLGLVHVPVRSWPHGLLRHDGTAPELEEAVCASA
ncbi:D-glycero-alpha-D-manno-heptose-7-phosphate kinase [Allocatelliglobosispora scoriae]|uniref:D-glycero-alpha-D-manno-heptose-7-phosphate kinase n=1 Tax=Allocatelliglobosispora scoriae TaxID=643052 RepID=A0A841BGW5_9ACTN|nr:hypothetical protein [Allocatelliglobosispora scoriae]MBB5868327.1 D-glycero-alpha-D-manno-heptose-7-phosphate kinase [Allocatelliglobosispora scoriae]